MNSKSKLPKSIKIDKAKKICELYSRGEYTIAACCKTEGVEYNTFLGWAQPNLTKEDVINGNYRRGFVQVVHDLYKEALRKNETNYKDLLKDAARQGILKRATGINYVETHKAVKYDIHGNSKGVVIKKIERYLPPDVTLLIFLANCLGIFNWQTELNSLNSVAKDLLQHLTYEQLRAKRLELEEIINN